MEDKSGKGDHDEANSWLDGVPWLQTRYDPLSSCLVDFKGRATAASVKNFQLMKSFPEDNDQRKIYYSEKGRARAEWERETDRQVSSRPPA